MKPTVNDKLRLALLLFHEDVKEYVGDILSRTKSSPDGSNDTSNRPNLDASNARKKTGLAILLQLFKNPDVTLRLPSRWEEAAAKEETDELRGEGVYEMYGDFHPNDSERIKLPWEQRHMKTIFAQFWSEYSACSKKWTMDTGGGPGNEATFVTWSKRDPLKFSGYVGQDSNLYLTPIYIMDKDQGFLLVEVKDNLPKNCQIEDNPDETVASTAKKNSSDDKVVEQFKEIVKDMSAARTLESKELRDILNGSMEDEETEVVNMIERTTNLIGIHEAKVSQLDEQTRSILSGAGSTSEKKRKLHPVQLERKSKMQLVQQLNATLAKASSKLAKINGTENGNNGDNNLFDDLSIHST